MPARAGYRMSMAPRKSLAPGLRGSVTFFTFPEALQEVSKEDGAWNWALVGPDPETLPLCGGGPGSVDEMRAAVGDHMFSYGLLRLNFGVGPHAKTKFIYIEASNLDSEKALESYISPMHIGQARAQSPAMKQAMQEHTSASATVSVTSAADLTLDTVLLSLQKGVDAKLCTKEKYEIAMELFRSLHKEALTAEKLAQELADEIGKEHNPAEEAAGAEAEVRFMVDSQETEGVPRQRSIARGYKEGDQVMVRNKDTENSKKWIDDAEVVEKAKENCLRDGFKVEAGAIKIMYSNRKQYQWVSIPLFNKELRPSRRPKRPMAKVGTLEKETHTFISKWNVRYFELKNGFLMWWTSKDDLMKEKPERPSGVVSMLGLRSRLSGREFNFKAASGKGTVFSFRAETPADADEWIRMLNNHAIYAEELGQYIAYMNADDLDGVTVVKDSQPEE